MLIVINFPSGFSEQKQFSIELLERMTGRVRVFLPETYEEYAEAVKKYRPSDKSHVILLASHYTLLRDSDVTSKWRSADYYLQSRGGAVWGVDPGRETLSFAGAHFDPNRIVQEAEYNCSRAIIFTGLSRQYIGRTQSDPHTAILGVIPSFPSNSKVTEYVLSSLPSEWWTGVAFLDKKSDNSLKKTTDWLEDTRFVSVGDVSHERFEELGIEHGALPDINSIYRNENHITRSRFGLLIRETARTYEDNREWTGPRK